MKWELVQPPDGNDIFVQQSSSHRAAGDVKTDPNEKKKKGNTEKNIKGRGKYASRINGRKGNNNTACLRGADGGAGSDGVKKKKVTGKGTEGGGRNKGFVDEREKR